VPVQPLPVQPLRALRGVSGRFTAVQALGDVEAEIRAGEVVAVTGAISSTTGVADHAATHRTAHPRETWP
jgi:hypothetical protein